MFDGKIDGREVQVKISQETSIEVKGIPEFMIVIKILWIGDNIEIYEVYNGPREDALKGKSENSYKERSISINKLSIVSVDKDKTIPRKNHIKKWSGINLQ